MFEPTKLDPWQIRLAEKTISANAFFLIAQDALMRRKSLSVVRMADGELSLWKEAADGSTGPTQTHTEKWRVNLGVEGIQKEEMMRRLRSAAASCDYFAPSLSGLVDPAFNLYPCFPARDKYVDVFFCNAWSEEMITHLYKEAKHVLIVHRNPNTAHALALRAKHYLGVAVTHVKQDNWTQTGDLIERVSKIDAPLVLASVGPAGKYSIPRMASSGKVVLDVGNSMDNYLLEKTWLNDKNRNSQLVMEALEVGV